MKTREGSMTDYSQPHCVWPRRRSPSRSSLRRAGVWRNRSSRRSTAARWRSARSTSRSRRCRGIPPTGTGSTTTTPALVYEQLFAADLSQVAGGTAASIRSMPTPGCRRTPSAANSPRSWEWKQNPLRVEINLRKGVMFPDKPGVMAARELVADDVVFSLQPPRQEPEEDHRLFRSSSTRSRPPTSTRSSSPSRTTTPSGTTASAGATTPASCRRKWPTPAPATGRTSTAPARSCSTDFVQGNSNTYVKNPIYWDKEKIGGAEYKLPFVDKVIYRTIKDEATFLTALRTGKLDMLESIRWQRVDELKKSAPQLQWSKWLSMSGHVPGDARRHQAVRRHPRAPRAQLAVNKQEIVKAYYGGNAELFAYPQHPDYLGYFEPLESDAGLGQGALHLQSRRRPRSCWPRPATRRASPSRCRSAPARPTTWTCCRWSRPISSRSASRSRSSRWNTARSCRP